MSEPYKTAAPTTDITLLGAEHVRVYRETDGETGYLWNGAPILLLTSTGRKSGEARTNPIIFTAYDGGWVVMASKGGAPTHPAWYLNVREDPKVEVQVKAERFAALARTARSPEREAIWAEALKVWPSYEVYQSRTEREIPVVVLEPQRRLEKGERAWPEG